jgi:hypothetical protein
MKKCRSGLDGAVLRYESAISVDSSWIIRDLIGIRWSMRVGRGHLGMHF